MRLLSYLASFSLPPLSDAERAKAADIRAKCESKVSGISPGMLLILWEKTDRELLDLYEMDWWRDALEGGDIIGPELAAGVWPK